MHGFPYEVPHTLHNPLDYIFKGAKIDTTQGSSIIMATLDAFEMQTTILSTPLSQSN